jgi:hypothetical protein
VTAALVLQTLIQNPGQHERLRSAIQILCPVRGGGDMRDVSPNTLGIKLRALKGRWKKVVISSDQSPQQLALEHAPFYNHSAILWRVKSQVLA